MFTEAFGQFGISSAAAMGFLKGTGIVGAIGLIIFLVIRHKVVRFVAVDQGTEWIRAKWDVAQYHRLGKQAGRLRRMKAGRHFLVRGIYDGWQVPLKEIVPDDVIANLELPFGERMLKFSNITIGYTVIAPDTLKGDKMMLRYILSVQNINKQDQQSAAMTRKVIGITLNTLGNTLERMYAEERDIAELSEQAIMEAVAKELKKKHGVRLSSFKFTRPVLLASQQQYDAGKLIADALSGAHLADVVPLPRLSQEA